MDLGNRQNKTTKVFTEEERALPGLVLFFFFFFFFDLDLPQSLDFLSLFFSCSLTAEIRQHSNLIFKIYTHIFYLFFLKTSTVSLDKQGLFTAKNKNIYLQ